MNNQDQIFSLIKEEKKRQLGGLELIASENFTSDNVMKATGSILTNKYAEGYPVSYTHLTLPTIYSV